ncbi:MAG: spore coat U domain-containing protein [Burkholderiaceae bacterium]
MKALRVCLFSIAVLTVAPQAQALCLLCSCTVSATPVAFGAYNPIDGSSASGSGDVQVNCSGTVGLFVDYSIALSSGIHGATYDNRQMANGASRLTYQLYGDSGGGGACSVVWGDGSGATSTVGGSLLIVLLGSVINRQVCGTLPANQTGATAGSYSDTVQVVVTYN